MGKKKAVKLGINLGQYPNGGGGHLSQPNQINKVPGRLPFKNKTIQASSGLSKMFHVFRSTNVTMYALWVKINKFNHCHVGGLRLARLLLDSFIIVFVRSAQDVLVVIWTNATLLLLLLLIMDGVQIITIIITVCFAKKILLIVPTATFINLVFHDESCFCQCKERQLTTDCQRCKPLKSPPRPNTIPLVTHKSKSKCSFFREAFERKKWLEVGIILGFFHGKGGGVSQSQPFYTKKMGIFQEKIICLE